MTIEGYRDLHVWQKGLDLAQEIYQLTSRFPKSELYGLTNQMQRAAVSIAANIAEGYSRESTKDYLRHVSIALGSLAELETFLTLAERLSYCTPADSMRLLDQCDHEGRMLRTLQKQLKKRLDSTPLAPSP